MMKKRRINIKCVIILLAGILIVLVLSNRGPIKKNVTVEVGSSSLDINDFLKDEDTTASFQTTLTEDELKTLGTYKVIVECNDKEYTVKVTVKDTIAPTATLQDGTAYVGDEVSTDIFVEEYDDVTDVEVSFKKSVSTKRAGEQEVTLVFTDTSGNSSEYTAMLNVIEDTEAPVFSGLTDIELTEGGIISYKSGVTVTDNRDDEVEYSIDNSEVDANIAGTYEVTYSATDEAGNTATETRTVIVYEKSTDGIDIETVYDLADEVLASIITDDMTGYEKLEAIYNWVRSNITYANSTDKTAYYISAYQGFKQHYGDCYVYWATSKVLLTRAGITNMDIKKSDTTIEGHYWNLVDIGEGWYHFDTTPRKGDFDGLYLTDEELMAYSESHNNSHIYDASLYPDIE